MHYLLDQCPHIIGTLLSTHLTMVHFLPRDYELIASNQTPISAAEHISFELITVVTVMPSKIGAHCLIFTRIDDEFTARCSINYRLADRTCTLHTDGFAKTAAHFQCTAHLEVRADDTS